jgi:hypothetical protein
MVNVGAPSSAYASASAAGLAKVAAEVGCGSSYPYRVYFTYGNGLQIPDLIVCTNNSSTMITNISADVVWHVYYPKYSYWTLNQDVALVEQDSSVDSAADTILYRLWLTFGAHDPYLSIEPGNNAILPDPPGDIKLGHGAGEEATWQAISVMADSMTDKTRDTLVKLLEDHASPTANAIIKCAQTAYNLGQNIYSGAESEDIASELSGMFKSGAQCGQAVEDARDDLAARSEEPKVALDDVQDHIRAEDDHWGDTDTLVDDIAKFIEDGLKAHEI